MMVSPTRPPASSENARQTMRANRRVSRRELAFRHALWAAGLRGYRVGLALPGRPDVAFPGPRVAVFVHGCFWHRCPSCALPEPKANADFWSAKFTENRRRDSSVQATLEELGWCCMVIWEHELRQNPDECVRRVGDLVERRRSQGHPHA